jgi:hypothetical protein
MSPYRPNNNFIILLRVRRSGSSRSWGVEKAIEMHNFVTLCHARHLGQYTMASEVRKHSKRMSSTPRAAPNANKAETQQSRQCDSLIWPDCHAAPMNHEYLNSTLQCCSINTEIPGVDEEWCVLYKLKFP